MIRKTNEQPLKEILTQFYQSKKIKRKLDEVKVRRLWKEMMGPSIIRYTSEIRLTRAKVYVKIDSAPLKQELSFGKAKILKMYAKELGEGIVEDIVFM